LAPLFLGFDAGGQAYMKAPEHFDVGDASSLTEPDQECMMSDGLAPQWESAPSGIVTLIGNSHAMSDVYRTIRLVSQSDATILLRGESGTGKELVAKAIHAASQRANGPFVALHCAAVTESLLESELFGHEPGAFTGAIRLRKGRFEQAHGGTLFLDEVGDIPVTTQVKLLRVLQDRRFERVGGTQPVAVDIRLIGATHRDLEGMIIQGAFREDLYYRLNVVPITLPPLRDRIGDILLLIGRFLARFNAQHKRRVSLSEDLLNAMEGYYWPGNVRELQNCIERLVVIADRDVVRLDRLPVSFRDYFVHMQQVANRSVGQSNRRNNALSLGKSLQEIERRRLVEALERAGWVQAQAARTLGLTPRQVAYKIRKYGLRNRE
jgi:Nif-specific regulatory protein